MSKRTRSLLIAFVITILFLFLWFFKPECIFKSITGISCPACGLTRAFESIFSGDFIGSFDYNILGFPLFACGVALIGMMAYDIIKNDNLVERFFIVCFNNYYGLIIIILILSMGINVYRAI